MSDWSSDEEWCQIAAGICNENKPAISGVSLNVASNLTPNTPDQSTDDRQSGTDGTTDEISMDVEATDEIGPGDVKATGDRGPGDVEATGDGGPGDVEATGDRQSGTDGTTDNTGPEDMETTGDRQSGTEGTTDNTGPEDMETTGDRQSGTEGTTNDTGPVDVEATGDRGPGDMEATGDRGPGDMEARGDRGPGDMEATGDRGPGNVETTGDRQSGTDGTTDNIWPGDVEAIGDREPGDMEAMGDRGSADMETTGDRQSGTDNTTDDTRPGNVETTDDRQLGTDVTTDDIEPGDMEATGDRRPGDVETTGDRQSGTDNTTDDTGPGNVETTDDRKLGTDGTTENIGPGDMETIDDRQPGTEGTTNDTGPEDLEATVDRQSETEGTTDVIGPGNVETTDDRQPGTDGMTNYIGPGDKDATDDRQPGEEMQLDSGEPSDMGTTDEIQSEKVGATADRGQGTDRTFGGPGVVEETDDRDAGNMERIKEMTDDREAEIADERHQQNPQTLANRSKKRKKRKLFNFVQQKKIKASTIEDDDFSSSDDNIPLYKLQLKSKIESEVESMYDSEDSFKPSKQDYNSSDSNLTCPSDDSYNSLTTLDTINVRGRNKKLKKRQKKGIKRILSDIMQDEETHKIKRNKTKLESTPQDKNTPNLTDQIQVETTPTENTKLLSDNDCCPQTMDNAIYVAKHLSIQEAAFNEYVITHHEKRLDDLLFMNGFRRKCVDPDGNCFFKSALPHISACCSARELRLALCDHMIEHPDEYIGYFAVADMSESFEEDMAWIEFRQEIEALTENGRWTSRAADLLPLALANWTGRKVRIFSSLSERPILDITPNIGHCTNDEPILDDNPNIGHCTNDEPILDDNQNIGHCTNDEPILDDNQNIGHCTNDEPITLAYLASDNTVINEHYDICIKISFTGNLSDQERTEEDSGSSRMGCRQINESQHDENCALPCITPEKPKKPKGRPKGTPPRKAPNFITPPKKSLVRKRTSNPDSWKKNIRKRLRLSGKEYTSTTGKTINEKTIKSVDCSKCTFKCNLAIDEIRRKQIFQRFWSLETNERKKDFIIANTAQKKTRTYLDEENQPVPKKKQFHRSYFFRIDGNQVKVCRKFFLGTLGISETYANSALRNQEDGVFVGNDNRGKHVPHNKTSKIALETVCKHIESFPVVEGHYTRKDSNRKYLGSDLNITRMYQLYTEQCKGKLPEKDIVSPAVYRKVFNEQYNMSFHVPKKDQCGVCINYHRSNNENTLTAEMKDEYENHQNRKIRAREEKKRDKETGKSSSDVFVCTFDLQAVLQTPCSLVSQLYYMRKLNCYNLSIYNLANNNATCYLWSEVDAQRGSCEISTCLYLQLLSLPNNITQAVFYSDACSGQNRNQFTASCLLNAVKNHQSIGIIDHKFLESGHTQMECDSMHSAIEFAKKKTEIYIPQQWSTVVRMARRSNPYVVVPLKYSDIYDFKDLTKSTMKFRKEDVKGGKINWLQIRWLRYRKDQPDSILFKYKFDDEFRVMKVTPSKKRGRGSEPYQLKKKYNSKQPISAAKKKDLLSLCKSGAIPTEYHDYYKGLPANNNVKDCLPDTDVEEEREDSDQE